MLRSTLPAHPDTNLSLHSISIGPASAARAASSKSLYRKRARTSWSRHSLRWKRASDKALGLPITNPNAYSCRPTSVGQLAGLRHGRRCAPRVGRWVVDLNCVRLGKGGAVVRHPSRTERCFIFSLQTRRIGYVKRPEVLVPGVPSNREIDEIAVEAGWQS